MAGKGIDEGLYIFPTVNAALFYFIEMQKQGKKLEVIADKPRDGIRLMDNLAAFCSSKLYYRYDGTASGESVICQLLSIEYNPVEDTITLKNGSGEFKIDKKWLYLMVVEGRILIENDIVKVEPSEKVEIREPSARFSLFGSTCRKGWIIDFK